jgi:hypothetical protein
MANSLMVKLSLKAVLAVLIILSAAWSVIAVKAAVTLTYFVAQGQADSIRLTWETASELDNSGYYIRRSLTQTGQFNRISSFIPSIGDSLIGATYFFTDTSVTIGIVYWYQLESVDFSQNSQLYDPVSAVAGSAFATQTAIARTPTATVSTATATTISATATSTPIRTATQAPTSTGAYPGPATSTLPVLQPASTTIPPGGGNLASTELPTADLTNSSAALTAGNAAPGTATLIPLPEITLEFSTPAPGSSTPGAIAMGSGAQAGPTSADTGPSSSGWLTPGRMVFLGLILLVWVLLGVWFFFSMKRVQ